MTAYYNEIDPFAAAWLRELIKADVIVDGEVDERSIEDVVPSDLVGFTQCHFFAGIGVWSHALRLAGWPDDRPVWTGSCPCQPFSAAGKGGGLADKRNLWPAFEWLIRQCRPVVCFGEQVASAVKYSWFDHVALSLEGIGYAVGAAVSPSCSYGSPHKRQRLYWVADASGMGLSGVNGGRHGVKPENRLNAGELGDSDEQGPQGRRLQFEQCANKQPIGPRGATNGFWANAEWIPCRDGKARPVKPGTFPLVARTIADMVYLRDPGAPINPQNTAEARVQRLRGYGNCIVFPQAVEFIRAYIEIENGEGFRK